MFSPDIRIDIHDNDNLSTIPERNPWNVLQPLWKKMHANPMLTGMGGVSKYLLYALGVHILSVEDRLSRVEERLSRLENAVFTL